MKRYISNPCDFGLDIKGTDKSYEKLKSIIQNLDYVEPVFVKNENGIDKKQSVLKSNQALYKKVLDTFNNSDFPIIIGGDHSIAMGSISAACKKYNDLSVLWIDAHADMNTYKTSESKNIHGMPLAYLIGLENDDEFVNIGHSGAKLLAENVFIFGLRSLDKEEKQNADKVNTFYMADIKKDFDKNLDMLFEKIKTKHLHISFDLDSINPDFIPGVSTPVKSGLLPEQIFKIFDKFCIKTVSIDVVEYNPLNDVDDKTLNFLKGFFEYLEKNFDKK